jgi:hypothetical protein
MLPWRAEARFRASLERAAAFLATLRLVMKPLSNIGHRQGPCDMAPSSPAALIG